MYCFECGHELNTGAKFCYNCGTPQNDIKSPVNVDILFVDENDLTTEKKLKYYNNKPFSGKSLSNWEYYDQSEDMDYVSDNDLVKKKRETSYLDGKPHGFLTVFQLNEVGQFVVIQKQEYFKGDLNYNAEFEIDGSYINKQIYKNGKIELSEVYIAGKIWIRNFYSGVKITKESYYSNTDQLSCRKTVVPDSLGREQTVGTLESYNENGKPLDKLFFNQSGNADGVWERYNNEGELFLKQVYKNGKLIDESYDETKKRAWFRYKN